jgi:hypothetical protein
MLSADAVKVIRIVQLNFNNIRIPRYVIFFVVVLHFRKENLIQLKYVCPGTTKLNFLKY